MTPEPPAKNEVPLSGRSAALGFGALLLGRGGTMVLSFASTAVLARLLTPADFGVVAGAFAITSLADAIFEGTFGIGMVQKRKVDQAYASATLQLSLIFATTIWAALALSAPYVQGFFGFDGLSAVMTVMALTIIFKALSSPSKALLQRQHRFQLLSLITVGSYFVGYCVVAIILAAAGFGVWALAAGALLTGVLEGIGSFLAAKISLRNKLNMELAREILQSSGYFTLAQILNWGANAGASIVVGKTLGVVELGTYSRGWKLLSVAISATATPMSRVLLPAFARRQGDLPAARSAFITSLTLALPVFGAASGLCMLHADAIVRITLGPKWHGVVPVVQLLFFALIPRCAIKISESVAYGFGRSRGATLRQGFYAFVMVIGALIGSRFGSKGVALGASIGIWMFYAASTWYARRLLDLSSMQVANAHLRAAIFVAPALTLDAALTAALQRFGFWPSQVVSAGAAGFALLAVAAFAPPLWMGSVWADRRAAIALRIRRRFSAGSGGD